MVIKKIQPVFKMYDAGFYSHSLKSYLLGLSGSKKLWVAFNDTKQLYSISDQTLLELDTVLQLFRNWRNQLSSLSMEKSARAFCFIRQTIFDLQVKYPQQTFIFELCLEVSDKVMHTDKCGLSSVFHISLKQQIMFNLVRFRFVLENCS